MRSIAAALLFASLAWVLPASAQTLKVDISSLRICSADGVRHVPPGRNDPRCRAATLREVDPQGRLMWVQLDVTAKGVPSSREPIGLFLSALAASEVFWDQDRLGSNGTPGLRPSDEVPGEVDAVFFIAPNRLADGAHVLSVLMSSHHLQQTVLAPLQRLEFAAYASPRESRLASYLVGIPALGALAVTALYFGLIYVVRRPHDRSALYLSLMALAGMGQLSAEISRSLVAYDYTLHLWRLGAVALCALVFSVLLAAYTAHRFAPRQRLVVPVATLVLALAGAFSITAVDGRTLWILATGVACALVATAMGVFSRVPGSRFALAILAAFAGLMLYDSFDFLDRRFFVALTVLTLGLFASQVLDLRRIDAAREESRLRASRAELELLRMQIQPHFLMNTLTSLSEWIEAEPKTAVRMIDALADEFRMLARISSQPTITLAQEIDLCERHLKVMSFQRDQPFSLDTQGVDTHRPVPPAIFHTLIENALTHNEFEDGCRFVLREHASPGGRKYEFEVPTGTRRARSDGSGGGRAYIEARLAEAFGSDWSFVDGATADGGWLSAIEIRRA